MGERPRKPVPTATTVEPHKLTINMPIKNVLTHLQNKFGDHRRVRLQKIPSIAGISETQVLVNSNVMKLALMYNSDERRGNNTFYSYLNQALASQNVQVPEMQAVRHVYQGNFETPQDRLDFYESGL